MDNLRSFRERLTALMQTDDERPFLCNGDPLTTKAFIVGFNPATTVTGHFWDYWSDETGFDKKRFMEAYLAVRKLRGARPRIEAIVSELPPGAALETNICSRPTKRAADLAKTDQRTETFKFLFETIKPALVYVHSNQPIAYMEMVTGGVVASSIPQSAEWLGHQFLLCGRGGPLWRTSIAEAHAEGGRMSEHV